MKYKIGILTYHKAHNYGAYLQACALCNRINEENNIEAEIIDFRMIAEKNVYAWKTNIKWFLKNPLSYRFYKKLNSVFEYATSDDLMKKSAESLESDSITDFAKFVKDKYDVIIAGSDEIWKIDGFRGFPTPYWLIGDLGCRKFSYAASSRSDLKKLTSDNLNIIKQATSDFEFIGVRDKKTYDELFLLNNNLPLHLCCDPSFLFDFKLPDRNIYDFLKTKTSNINKDKKIITVMTEDKQIARQIVDKLSGKYNLISVFHWHRGYINIADLTPLEWVELISKSDFVLTSYFHATCFSIIKGVPFLSFGTEIKKTKLMELLKEFECEYRFIDDIHKIDLEKEILDKSISINYKNKIAIERNKFIQTFLKQLRSGKVN